MTIHPIHVREGDAVDIHWHLKNKIFIERRTVPPPEVTQEPKKEIERG